MRYLVTGASGFIGGAICKELIAAGHQVVGLARSEASAVKLKAAGVVEVVRGTLEDLDVLAAAAKASDGVVHCGFIHDDFSKLHLAGDIDARAVATFGDALAGSGKALVISSAILTVHGKLPGQLATEDDVADVASISSARASTELATSALRARGVRACVMRLPPTVHGDGDHGFVPFLISLALGKAASGYPGDGANQWAAVHVRDAARAYCAALAKGDGTYHVIAEQGIATKEIAGVIARRLGVPAVSVPNDALVAHFAWLSRFIASDTAASSEKTQRDLDWHPKERTLLDDLEHGTYFDVK